MDQLEVYKQIGQMIRHARERDQKSQSEIASKLGFRTAQFVSLFERGVSKVPYDTLGKLIKMFALPEKKVVDMLVASYRQELLAEIKKGKKSAK